MCRWGQQVRKWPGGSRTPQLRASLTAGLTQHAEQAFARESAGAASAHLDKRLGTDTLVRTRLPSAVAVQRGGRMYFTHPCRRPVWKLAHICIRWER